LLLAFTSFRASPPRLRHPSPLRIGASRIMRGQATVAPSLLPRRAYAVPLRARDPHVTQGRRRTHGNAPTHAHTSATHSARYRAPRRSARTPVTRRARAWCRPGSASLAGDPTLRGRGVRVASSQPPRALPSTAQHLRCSAISLIICMGRHAVTGQSSAISVYSYGLRQRSIQTINSAASPC